MSGSRSEAPLFGHNRGRMSLAEASVASRFHSWRGHSGHRYIASVFAVDHHSADHGLPDYSGAIVIPIRRQATSCVPIGVFHVERVIDRRAALAAGRAHGVDEWHVHLLACTRSAREAAAADLRGQHAPADAMACA